MRYLTMLGLSLWLAATPLVAGDAFAIKPNVKQAGNQTTITFALTAATDVEVAIVNSANKVVRHLAAGAIGAKQAPPAPLQAGLAQRLNWDGRDDDGQVAQRGPFRVRVRTGMGVKVDAIAGGDPYAWWTEDSGQGDHAQWRITGLEAKSDGKVYLFGNFTPYGLPTLRQYDARGNYCRTVFPPAANKSAADVHGWGVNVRDDGSWTLKPNYTWSGTLSEWTLMAGGADGGGIWSGFLVPTPEPDQLCLVSPPWAGNRLMKFGVDGSLPKFAPTSALGGEPLPRQGLIRSYFTALAPDGKSLYVSGLSTLPQGFWREGQIWKVDIATRATSVFFSLSEDERQDRAAIGHSAANHYSAFQGVAVDRTGHVFVCDRMNQRVLVLGPDGKAVRSLPVAHPDAVAVNPKTKALYVTTRFGAYSGNGKLTLLKFADWSSDESPAVTVPLRDGIGKRQESSLLTVIEDHGETLIWVAYTQLPARVYKDAGKTLELVKDFYEGSPQRALDLQHMTLDPQTGHVYIADSQSFLFRLRDWQKPIFEPCLLDAKTRLHAASVAIDARSRHLYTKRHYNNPIQRWNLDGEYFTPEPVAGSHDVIPPVTCAWVFTGLWERGMAACPEGVATLGVVVDGKGARWDDYRGPLTFFHANREQTPWSGLKFANFGGKYPNSGGVAFDRQGNLYVGLYDRPPTNIPPGFEQDKDYPEKIGRILKYAPTGGLSSGNTSAEKTASRNLFPTEPDAPAKVYDVEYGPLVHLPRFAVDDFGRIYFPNGLLPRVGIIDNEGNPIHHFGTWGNRDSLGGLPGDLVPTKDIPLAWPSSVQVDDNFIYVSDILNARLLRLTKTFTTTETIQLP